MKTSLQWIGILLVALGLYRWQPWSYLPKWRWKSESEISLHASGEVITQDRTFLLKPKGTLSFPLSPRVQEVKVVSFGLADEKLIGESSPGWAMDLEILGGDGEVLRQGLGRHRSRPMLSDNHAKKTIIAGMPHLLPMEGRSWLIRLPEGVLPSQLILRGVPMPGIEGILVKVEASLPTNEGLRKVYWSRLTPQDRRYLAKSTVYPGYLLRPREKNLLLREASRPLGPSGIEGRDYQTVNLYSFRLDEEPSPEEPSMVFPPYLPMKPNWEFKFLPPATSGPLKIWTEKRRGSGNEGWVCFQMTEGEEEDELFPIAQGSYGDNLDLTSFSGNQLVIRAIGEGNVLLLDHSQSGPPLNIEPIGVNTSIWTLGEGLDFPIYIPENETIPIRITSYHTSSTPLPFFWKVLGNDGSDLASGHLMVEEPIASPRFGLSDNLNRIPTFSSRHYLKVDSKMKTLKFWGDPGLFVQVHHRLPRWERERDDLKSQEEDEDLNWFSLPPNTEKDIDPLPLMIPSRQEIEASSRQWSSILPSTLARFSALGQKELQDDQKVEVLSTRPTGVALLPAEDITEVEIGEGSDLLSPKLIVFVEEDVESFQFFRKEELLVDEPMPKGCTILRLGGWTPKVKFPVHWKAAKNNGIEVFLEKVVGAGNRHIRTLGVCGQQQMRLTLPPIDAENAVVSIRWYRPTPDPFRMRLVWENAPTGTYTLSENEVESSRIYRVKTSDLVLRPLGGDTPYLHASDSMFFPVSRMKKDKPVKVRLEFPDGAVPFISMNLGLPGDEDHDPFSMPNQTGNVHLPSISSSPPKALAPPMKGEQLIKKIQDALKHQYSQEVTWVGPALRNHIENLFFDIFSGQPADAPAWAKHGLKVETLDHGRLLMIQDLGPQGRGLFVIRPQSDSALMLQAPHRWKDLHTGSITTSWFSNHEVAAACWNTAHRWVDLQGIRWQQDHCDRRESLFNAFARAFVRARTGKTRVLQLHGYDTLKHHHAGHELHEMILSNGTRQPGKNATSLFSTLKESFPLQHPALYPRDTKSLGALQNAQGHALRPFGDVFLHLELGLDFRLSLKKKGSQNLKSLHHLMNKSSPQGWMP